MTTDESAKTPLLEAVCEFRFEPMLEWDWTVPGRMFAELKAEFSDAESFPPASPPVELRPGETKIIVPTAPQLVRLRRPDGSALIQVGPGILAVNHFPIGYGWRAFLSLILRIYELHSSLATPGSPASIALRYINRFVIDDVNSEPARIVATMPQLPSQLAGARGIYQRIEMEHTDPPGSLLVQIALQPFENVRALMVDLTLAGTSKQFSLDGSFPATWLESAHTRIKESFGSTLHATVRSTLKL